MQSRKRFGADIPEQRHVEGVDVEMQDIEEMRTAA
jgi:hypothetical protein